MQWGWRATSLPSVVPNTLRRDGVMCARVGAIPALALSANTRFSLGRMMYVTRPRNPLTAVYGRREDLRLVAAVTVSILL